MDSWKSFRTDLSSARNWEISEVWWTTVDESGCLVSETDLLKGEERGVGRSGRDIATWNDDGSIPSNSTNHSDNSFESNQPEIWMNWTYFTFTGPGVVCPQHSMSNLIHTQKGQQVEAKTKKKKKKKKRTQIPTCTQLMKNVFTCGRIATFNVLTDE